MRGGLIMDLITENVSLRVSLVSVSAVLYDGRRMLYRAPMVCINRSDYR
jgi:hypothetical protein